MTPTELENLGDQALAELSRADDGEAFAELWRRHAGAGTTAARQFTAIADPQDIVSEAYVRILGALQRGGGPHEAFRPYLYRTIRNIALDWRPRYPSVALDETADLVDPESSVETSVLENAVTAKAFKDLPERWQAVLWYVEVEGMSPSDAAPFLGLSPNATSALAARAHEGFKKAWLQAHVNDRSVPEECRWTTDRMARYVRHSLTRRSRTRFDRHLEDCDRCALLLQEIGELGGQLASVLLPITLGGTAGSLLLWHLREAAVSSVAAAIVPAAAPTGAAILSSAAAVVLIASGGLLASSPVDRPQPPTATGGEPSSVIASVPDPQSDPELSPPPDAPLDAPTPEAEPPAPVEAAAPAPSPEATDPADPPLVDLSLSLLGGAVELDAVVDIDPLSGVLDGLLPEIGLLGL